MSASEKLRTLQGKGHHLYLNGVDVDIEAHLLAVVEAAESYREEFALRGVQTAESGQAWRDLQVALAALDEALNNGAETPPGSERT